jgi:hypothetical protein
MDYRIRVPRDSRLAIRHSDGDVAVYDVSGAIDASVRTGDILMQLPAAGQYSLDAHCRFGGVYSEFPVQTGPAPAKRVFLRVGIGGIAIQKMAPAEPQAIATPPADTAQGPVPVRLLMRAEPATC